MFIDEQEVEYAKWWNKIITESELVDTRYAVKGLFVWMPYGFSVMSNIKKKWVNLFEKEHISETYFPLLVPIEYALQNNSWWESFKSQAFYVNGLLDNNKNVFLRPTGEPAMYPMFSLWIRSHRDLPLRIYETVSSFRNETKSTKPLVRDVEIGPWYEIHTCHANMKEAEEEINLAIKMNEEIFDYICISPIKVRKPIYDCFPGSVGAVEFYTIMNDKVLENTSCNNLGQAYAKAFNITFFNSEGKNEFVWQTCTGNGERFLSAVVANHSDEKGLVLPSTISPIKAAIILFGLNKEEVLKEIKLNFLGKDFEVFVLDNFSKAGELRFKLEKKGVPLRIEVGPKEMKNKKATLIFRNGLKKEVDFSCLEKEIFEGLRNFDKLLLEKSEKEIKSRIKEVNSMEEMKTCLIPIAGWCGNLDCAEKIKNETGKELVGMTFKKEEKECVFCNKKGEKSYFSKSY